MDNIIGLHLAIHYQNLRVLTVKNAHRFFEQPYALTIVGIGKPGGVAG